MISTKYTYFEGHMKEVAYRVNEYLKSYITEWYSYLGNLRPYITVECHRNQQTHYYAIVAVVSQRYRASVDVHPQIFDLAIRDRVYAEYLRDRVVQKIEHGILMLWIETLLEKVEDGVDLLAMWREDLSKMVAEISFKKRVSTGTRPQAQSLLCIAVKGSATPIIETAENLADNPKLLLARLAMMK